jgi:hypothetical protein
VGRLIIVDLQLSEQRQAHNGVVYSFSLRDLRPWVTVAKGYCLSPLALATVASWAGRLGTGVGWAGWGLGLVGWAEKFEINLESYQIFPPNTKTMV